MPDMVVVECSQRPFARCVRVVMSLIHSPECFECFEFIALWALWRYGRLTVSVESKKRFGFELCTVYERRNLPIPRVHRTPYLVHRTYTPIY